YLHPTDYRTTDEGAASRQFFNLVSECDDSSSLRHAVPVMVQRFDYVDHQFADVEAALVHILDPDTLEDTKVFILRELTRIKREKFRDLEQSVEVITRILLRIQEQHENENENEPLYDAAFRALVFLSDRPITSSECKSDADENANRKYPITPESKTELVTRGFEIFESSEDIYGADTIPLVYLGALLEFERMPSADQDIVLRDELGKPSLRFPLSYMIALFWMVLEAHKWDRLSKYRKILVGTLRAKLDDALAVYPGRDLLTKLAPTIEGLGDSINSMWQYEAWKAGRHIVSKVCMGMLRRLRRDGKLPDDHSKFKLNLGVLAAFFPRRERVKGSNENATSIDIPTLKRSDLIMIRDREALLFFMDRYASAESFGDEGCIKFLDDCDQLGKAVVPGQSTTIQNASSVASQGVDHFALRDDDLKTSLEAEDLNDLLSDEEKSEAAHLLRQIADSLRRIKKTHKIKQASPDPATPEGEKESMSLNDAEGADDPITHEIPSTFSLFNTRRVSRWLRTPWTSNDPQASDVLA
ncbi:hypothetical protein SISSUDRAFT_1035981, partial [Sistotremastrum suecicum HHB10207 ss-3]